MSKFVNNNNTSRPDGNYSTVIENIAKDGVCPFCEERITVYHKLPISHKKYWLVTDNMYPYKPTRQHRLFICRRHIENISELSPDEWAELKVILDVEAKERSIAGGALIIRFGDTRFTGASVTHLHGHIVQSDPDDKNYEPTKGLMMRIG